MMEGIIVKGVAGAYTVSTQEGIFVCNARGVFRSQNITPLIGDHVTVTIMDENERTGILQAIHPRKNELIRPRAANVDQVIVTMAAAQPSFHTGLLDRYLLLVGNAQIPVVICVNKADLREKDMPPSSRQLDELCEIYANAGYPVILVSTVTGEGLDRLRDAMRNKISVFAGPSGVGKSSLINCFSPEARRETGELSVKIERGRHTTRHTEILRVEPTGYCIDTPGFSALDINVIPVAAYARLFIEFTPFLGQCRFTDCRHDTEVGCAVKEQVGQAIHPLRYQSYLQLIKK